MEAHTPPIFNTVPKNDIFGLYNKNKGHLKYQAVANTINFNRQEVSKATRININAVKYKEDEIPDKIKEFFISITWLLHTTHTYLKDKDKVIKWLDSPNPACGGYSPKDMIRMGQYKKLVRIVSCYAEGKIP